MRDRNEQLSAMFRPLIGQKPWQVRLGWGSFITMEFGKRSRDSWMAHGEQHSAVHGQWHLWIYQCDWKLTKNRRLVVSSDDPRDRIRLALGTLEGRTLESVHLFGDDFHTDFLFRGGLRLRTTGYEDGREDEERWLLYTPDHKVLINLPGMLVVQNSKPPARAPRTVSMPRPVEISTKRAISFDDI